MRGFSFILILIVFLFINSIEVEPRYMRRHHAKLSRSANPTSNYLNAQKQMFSAEMAVQNKMQAQTTEVSVALLMIDN
jgi:hypothetical protein